METISLQGKTNFFKKRVGEYSKSGVGIDQVDQSFALDASFWDEWNDDKCTAQYYFFKKHYPLHHMCSLRGFTKLDGKHADMEVIVKSNDFPREETQSFSLGRTKPTVVA